MLQFILEQLKVFSQNSVSDVVATPKYKKLSKRLLFGDTIVPPYIVRTKNTRIQSDTSKWAIKRRSKLKYALQKRKLFLFLSNVLHYNAYSDFFLK